jgi:hypothetical protein
LLVFDNVDCWDTITNCWPPGTSTGSIIITSRDWSLADQPASGGEELTKLDPSDSRALFGKLLRSYEQNNVETVKAFEQILEIMDGLPLAIHQVASIINSYQYELPKFVAMYKDNRSLMHRERGVSSYAFYKDTLHSVWKFPSGETENTDKQLRHLLGVLSLLSPDSIPEKLLQQALSTHGGVQDVRKMYGEEMTCVQHHQTRHHRANSKLQTSISIDETTFHRHDSAIEWYSFHTSTYPSSFSGFH